jgi:hypothetical protein
MPKPAAAAARYGTLHDRQQLHLRHQQLLLPQQQEQQEQQHAASVARMDIPGCSRYFQPQQKLLLQRSGS